MIIRLDDNTFSGKLAEHRDLPFLVDFWTSRCELCRYIAPMLDEVNGEMNDSLVIGKLNVDESPYTVGLYNVRQVPVILVFSRGNPVHSFYGITRKEEILDFLKSNKFLT